MRAKLHSSPRQMFAALAIVVAFHAALVAGSPRPAAKAAPAPEALPAPTPLANAIAEAQTYNTYAPFSGAIYIVGAGGVPLPAAVPVQCPAAAGSYQGCGNINAWNWCCPTGCTCANLTNNVVGCCPAGSSCSGSINQAQITTVTVTTTVVQQTISTVAGVVVNPGSSSTTKPVPVYNGYCSTLRMHGYPIPTTAQGLCGTILIINDGAALRPGWQTLALFMGFYAILGIGGAFGFLRR